MSFVERVTEVVMGLKRLVICSEDNEVLFDGASQSVAPSSSGTFSAADSAPDERLTLPAPAAVADEPLATPSDYDDDAPTLSLNAVFEPEPPPTFTPEEAPTH